MKLSILLAGSILTSAIVGNVYAQTCGAQPSCSSLGYTYTGSTSDCVNTPMKCPFNTSYFNCTKKADVIKQFKPNWSGKRTVSKGSFYPSSSGFIFGKFFDINKYGAFVTVNGTKIGSITGLKKQGTTFFLMVASGDSINIDADNVQLYFVPFAGN